MAQCPNCGSAVSDQDNLCPNCGIELAGSRPGRPQFPPPQATPPHDVSDSTAHQVPLSGPTPREPLVPLKTGARALAGLAKLTLRRSGLLSSESFRIGEHVTIGRFDAETGPVDVDLAPLPEGAYLSRHHAEMWRDSNGMWFIKDLGSQNGTFVRPGCSTKFQRVAQDQPINDGDEIAFGNARFEFRIIKQGNGTRISSRK